MVLSPRSLCLQNWLKLHHLGPQFSEMAWCPADFPEDAPEAPSPGWSQNGSFTSTKWPCPTDFFKEPCLLKFRFGVLSALRSMAWCDHCSGMMMRNSTGTDDHVVMRCVSLIGDMSHVPTGCNLVVCYYSISWLDNTLQPHAELTYIYHSISWLDNTLQPHAELTCIYIYMHIMRHIMRHIHPDSIVKSFQREPSIPKQLNTNVIRGLVKRFNLYEMWTTSVKRW